MKRGTEERNQTDTAAVQISKNGLVLAMERRHVSRLTFILEVRSMVIADGLHGEKWDKVELGRKEARF